VVETRQLRRSGVVKGWTGVDISSSPLLPEVFLESDANPMSFYGGRSFATVGKIRRIGGENLLPLLCMEQLIIINVINIAVNIFNVA